MSTRNLPGAKGQLARKADNLNTICDQTVYKLWEPWHLITLWASMACYRDSFTFFIFMQSRSQQMMEVCSHLVFSYFTPEKKVWIVLVTGVDPRAR
jgi:hypothetical protein